MVLTPLIFANTRLQKGEAGIKKTIFQPDRWFLINKVSKIRAADLKCKIANPERLAGKKNMAYKVKEDLILKSRKAR